MIDVKTENEMTKQEFLKKYGGVKVKFSSYFKFTFTYAATLPDGRLLTCNYGGYDNLIYRHKVSADGEETVRGLNPDEGHIYQDGKEVESFRDY